MRALVLAVVGCAFVGVGLGSYCCLCCTRACCSALLLRARDSLTTERGRRGLETASQRRCLCLAELVGASCCCCGAGLGTSLCLSCTRCCCSALLLRARDFLTTETGPRGLETTSQPRVFFGSGREGALANAPRRERFSTKKDGELSWHPRGKNARLVRTAGRLEPAGATPGGPRASSRERLDRASSPAWRWRARGPRSRASWTGCR